MMRIAVLVVTCVACCVLHAAPAGVSFVQSSDSADCYRFIEVAVNVDQPDAANPFTDVAVEGRFTPPGGQPLTVEGFCDSADGKVFRIRFMPSQPGNYAYSVMYRQGTYEIRHEGKFSAQKSRYPGLLRVDREHPYHFIYEGSGEHFFWNSTTAYWLLGWRDDAPIQKSIERLAKLGVNRIRVALSGRTRDAMRWKESDVKPSDEFQFRLEPWPAARPENIEDPGYDVTRFNLDHFRKCERMLDHARKRGVQVSIIFHLDGADKGVDPFGKERMGGPDEQRYYRYVVARLAAFPNVMWDVTNEWQSGSGIAARDRTSPTATTDSPTGPRSSTSSITRPGWIFSRRKSPASSRSGTRTAQRPISSTFANSTTNR
jgi:hypothetical protein